MGVFGMGILTLIFTRSAQNKSPAITVEGVFRSDQQSFRVSQRIVAKEMLEIDVR